jgi:hypothetical protein
VVLVGSAGQVIRTTGCLASGWIRWTVMLSPDGVIWAMGQLGDCLGQLMGISCSGPLSTQSSQSVGAKTVLTIGG